MFSTGDQIPQKSQNISHKNIIIKYNIKTDLFQGVQEQILSFRIAFNFLQDKWHVNVQISNTYMT